MTEDRRPRYRTVVVPDFQDRSGSWVQLCCHRDLRTVSWSGDKYAGLKQRCSTADRPARFPSYVGCVNSFTDFQDFADWHRQQVGYGLPDRHLDKDILVKGSKRYSRDTCCLVPRQVNQLFANTAARRGVHPVGVRWDSARQKFAAQLSIDSKITPLGRFSSVEAAFMAYKAAKEAQIRAVALHCRESLDVKVFEALMAYQVEITD